MRKIKFIVFLIIFQTSLLQIVNAQSCETFSPIHEFPDPANSGNTLQQVTTPNGTFNSMCTNGDRYYCEDIYNNSGCKFIITSEEFTKTVDRVDDAKDTISNPLSSEAERVKAAQTVAEESAKINPLRDNSPTENSISQQSVSRGDGVLRYEMVSYSGNTPGAADTPFFNIGIFNSPTFTIDYKSFSDGFQDVFDFIIGISIAIAVVVFMIAAFQRVIGRESGAIGEVKVGDKGMWDAIVGLMIILSTWLIINTINPDLLRLSMFQNLDKLKPTNTQSNSGSPSGEFGSH